MFFNTISLKQSGFCATTYSFEIIVPEGKYKKNNLKNHESQQKNQEKYYEIQWFYQDFISGNLYFLIMCSVHTARILDLSLDIILCPPK